MRLPQANLHAMSALLEHQIIRRELLLLLHVWSVLREAGRLLLLQHAPLARLESSLQQPELHLRLRARIAQREHALMQASLHVLSALWANTLLQGLRSAQHAKLASTARSFRPRLAHSISFPGTYL